jgi:quinol monooxygenase YgiN
MADYTSVEKERNMSVIVTVRARLKAEPESIQTLHDQVTAATKEMAQAAGDISHKVFLNPQDRRDFVGIDEWQSAEAFQKFSGDPKIMEFFGQLFEGQPQASVWENPGWNQW